MASLSLAVPDSPAEGFAANRYGQLQNRFLEVMMENPNSPEKDVIVAEATGLVEGVPALTLRNVAIGAAAAALCGGGIILAGHFFR